jgi:cytochrome c553
MKTKYLITAAFAGAYLLSAPFSQANGELDVPKLWTKHCKKCHGTDGKGLTKMGRKLKANDYTDPKVQAKFTDEEALKLTLEGIINKDSGKEIMKPYKEKLSEDEAKALVQYIREFASKAEQSSVL